MALITSGELGHAVNCYNSDLSIEVQWVALWYYHNKL